MVSGIRKALQSCIAATCVPEYGRLIFEDFIQFRLLRFIIRMSQCHRYVSYSYPG